MVEKETHHETARLNAIFHALGDATRRHILRELAQGGKTVGELAAPFDMSLAAASKHIRVLENAGLIVREISGRTHHCRIEASPLESASDWLSYYERFWTDRLNILDRLLSEEAAESSPAKKTPKGEKK